MADPRIRLGKRSRFAGGRCRVRRFVEESLFAEEGSGAGAEQGESGHVVVDGRRARELLGGAQNDETQIAGGGCGCLLQGSDDAFEPQFFTLTFGFDDAEGDDQQDGTGRERNGVSVASRVGEQAEGQPSGGQVSDAGCVAQQAGGVTGVGIADCTQIFVKAADEGRATAHAALELENRAIELLAEFDHGVRLADFGCGEEARGEITKSSLRGDQDLTGVLAAAGDVEQAEENTGWTYTQKLIKIASHALPVVEGGEFGMTQGWDVGVQGVGWQCRRWRRGSEE